MNDRHPFSAARISELAVRQLTDYDKCQPGTMFANDFNMSVADAYRLQTAVAELRVARGERVIGYKVGCTSHTIREQLGIDHCITGQLYDSECHPAASKLSRQQFANLAIEGELAVELCRRPVSGDFSTAAIPACVSRVFPVIELHNHVIRGDVPLAGEVIANNAIHAGFVMGDVVLPAKVTSPEHHLSLKIFADDALIAECEGIQLVQTISSSLQWLLANTHQSGEQLKAGQIVLTGSIPKLIPIRENCRIKVVTQPFGSVDANFIV